MIARVIFVYLIFYSNLFASDSSHSDIGTFFWRVITFIIFIIIIYKVIKPLLIGFLDSYKSNIINNFNTAQQKHASVNKLLESENLRLLHLDDEIDEMKKKYYRQIEIEKEQLNKDADQEFIKYKNSIEKLIDGERKKALTSIIDNILKNTVSNVITLLHNRMNKDNVLVGWKENIKRLREIAK